MMSAPTHRSGGRHAARHRSTKRPRHSAASHATSRWGMSVAVAAVTLALTIPTALAAVGSQDEDASTTDDRSGGSNLVVNGGFEQGDLGWRTNDPDYQVMEISREFSKAGEAAAVLSTSRYGQIVLNDLINTEASTRAGRVYRLTAYVRAQGGSIGGRLRLREVSGGDPIAEASALFDADASGWSRVQLSYLAQRAGSKLDLNVVGVGVPPGVSLLIDEVSMTAGGLRVGPDPSAPPSPTVSPSASPTPSHDPTSQPSATVGPSPSPSVTVLPTDPPEDGCVDDPMGIPGTGAYLGAAVSGSSDIVTRESQLEKSLALHRTYFQAHEISAAVRTAKQDLAAGRLPWVSFKEPLSWSQMASGAGEEWTTQLADALATVPGPVWLAVHHEPEKDGDMDEWTAMQTRIAPIIHERTNNVAYSVIYSGWNTFGGGRNTVSTKWPGDENVDILAIDAYNDYGANRGGKVGTKVLELRAYYAKMAAWASAHGSAWAIGETGQTALAAAEDPTWLDRSFHDMVALGGSGLSYYDSSANSVADWTLDDPIKFARFAALQQESATLC